jgi:tetratricopeptide (TPR) repeat protein
MTNEIPRRPDDETAARRAIEIHPHSAIAHYNLGLLLAQDSARTSEAETAYRRAIELDPNNARYVYRLGLLLHEDLHRFAEAEIAYRRAIELAPDDPFYYGGLVSLLVQQSQHSDAIALGAKMCALLNANKNWYGLATLDAILGNVEAALGFLRRASREATFNPQWARNDPDLATIRADSRFEEIVGNL